MSFCRDCADYGGTCPHSGEPCDPEVRINWTADRQAEFIMSGMSESEALRKAMEDWYTYMVVEPTKR